MPFPVASLRYATAGLSCFVMHHLVSMQYAQTCRTSWFAALGLEPSGYCVLLRRALEVLQWSPVGILMLERA